MAYAPAKGLVGRIVGTQGVAVHQQRRHTIQVDASGVGEQRHARFFHVARGQHEIPVSVHEIHRRTGIGQRLEMVRGIVRNLLVVVVADPGLEQVAQDVERVGTGNLFVEKVKKTPGGDRAFVGEVQVRDEEAAARTWFRSQAHRRRQTISALVMTTSSSGTSWCPARLPVLTFLILSTTSMPSTTLPNTA